MLKNKTLAQATFAQCNYLLNQISCQIFDNLRELESKISNYIIFNQKYLTTLSRKQFFRETGCDFLIAPDATVHNNDGTWENGTWENQKNGTMLGSSSNSPFSKKLQIVKSFWHLWIEF